jgi:hypothetical protein
MAFKTAPASIGAYGTNRRMCGWSACLSGLPHTDLSRSAGLVGISSSISSGSEWLAHVGLALRYTLSGKELI